ncbi:MAG: glycoside hydrolase family 92 protein [Pyrinomonadaceae bacterium]|nr:glycoside hydrolase family 92 protein [Pyrinomonadaceae bacterium]
MAVVVCFLFVNTFAQTPDFTRFVNPFIGTGGHGHTFPGATVPFGMVQLSPDTRLDDWDGSSGYHYSDSVIYGFSHTHLSGTGIPDYCDALFMPTIGSPQLSAKAGEKSENGYASKFSHQNEKAEAGYYSVLLEDDNIFAEMTATTRVGLHRYTFPKSDEANIILDLKWRDKVLDSELKIVGNNRIEGYRRSSSWAKDQIVYFVAEFSKPFQNALTGNGKTINSQSEKGENVKAGFRFKTFEGEKVLLKVAISSVSIEGARKNLKAELPDWNFEKVRADAKAGWNKELSKIEVSGGTDAQMTNFYTALYHTAIQPNIFQDVDGTYRGLDKKIHNIADSQNPKSKIQNPKSNYFTVFSLWDTFRAAHPLYTIIDQKRTADFINTFIRQYEQGGRLPVWELAGNETDTMIGYHAVSVIADAMAKNIKGFDYDKAFEAAKHSAELNHFGLESYKKRGYISMEDEQESVSKTLEYAYNDFCITQMAKILQSLREAKTKTITAGWDDKYISRKKADYEKYIRRARYFENLFDAETGFMRPKQNGSFIKPFAPNDVTFHFTEGNSWQYSFFVPHDVSRLIELHGGNIKFAKKLDDLFAAESKLVGREQPDITGLIGQYAHGNEPSHHIAYLYNYAGEPHKTQKITRQIMDEFYKPTPDGLIGNEDCGQMSAWYVLSALGFYQVNPSQAVYAFGSPIFPEAKINLENGKSFIIKAANISVNNFYIKSAKFNGVNHRKSFITHDDLMRGGVLEFSMTDGANKDWFAEFPVSKIEENAVAVPLIEAADRVFKTQNTISLKTTTQDAKIRYSIDGGDPKIEYEKPFTIDETAIVKAVTINLKGEKSLTAEAKFFKKPNDWTVKILSKYNRQYTGGGDEGLIDGIRGTTNFASGEWQGYQNQDFIAVIDLQKETEIKSVGGGFLQDARPWIWMPTRIEFEVSDDNVNFRKIAEIKTDVAPEDMKPQIKDYLQNIAPTKARYVRVKAVNLGEIPAWHPGAGSDAFIFVDEIFVR